MILDDLKVHAVREARAAAEHRRAGREDLAAAAELRAAHADRGVLLIRREEARDGDWMYRNRELYLAAEAARLVAHEPDEDLAPPPPPPPPPPSPSAGWSEDGETLRLWRGQYNAPGFRANSHDLKRAQEHGRRIEVLDEPAGRFVISRSQARNADWCALNRDVMTKAIAAERCDIV